MTIPRQSTALMIIDMQNSFLHPDGSMAAIGMPHEALTPAVAGCQKLVDAARTADVPVVFTRYVYMADYRDGGLLPNELVPAMREVDALVAGSWDAEIVEELTPHAGDVVIDKSRPSSFYGTQLEPVLTTLGIEHLVVAGVTTNICVESTVRDAGQRDYRTHVVADACAEFEASRHDHALNTMGFGFGWLTSVDEVVAAWDA
ncbi:MAG: cysteine hydrolase [Aeromicrobium sp.]|uniref:cysteine hydrolase family protein n=1 Tax=Aeromicrobium sp. TaxID=1871063 RepID=UPI0025C6EC62|nr:isochorismatase family cysteine hydrolase [Aeromicrobium sp.]MCK5891442.1 cysteine hydrolase [Aeromicrobium sp.]MDF1704683.1 cysteine hydrolase [Aeromicrobium sp.]